MTQPGHDPAWDLEPPPRPPDEPAPAAPRSMVLEFTTFADLRARVKEAGPAKYLIRPHWPAGEYGVFSAPPKDQKTWTASDLAVSVASGTPWLGHFPIDDPGPVLMFAGEGGERQIVRRIDAIAHSRNIEPDQLQIAVCARAPHLSDPGHLKQFGDALQLYKPRLVILDPFYLAARGAKLTDVYAMGALLEQAQQLCAPHNAALFVVHHNNRSREATGAERMSGAGPAEWGRVLMTAKSVSRRTDSDKTTHVLTEVEVRGGSIVDDKFRINRTIRATDPDDLGSDLTYTVDVLSADSTTNGDSTDSGLAPAAQKLLEALEHFDGHPEPPSRLVDFIVERHGHGLTRETVSRNLNALLKTSDVDCIEPDAIGKPKLWFLRRDLRDITREGHNEEPT